MPAGRLPSDPIKPDMPQQSDEDPVPVGTDKQELIELAQSRPQRRREVLERVQEKCPGVTLASPQNRPSGQSPGEQQPDASIPDLQDEPASPGTPSPGSPVAEGTPVEERGMSYEYQGTFRTQVVRESESVSPVGIDSVKFVASEFTVADTNELKVEGGHLDDSTGVVEDAHLYRLGGPSGPTVEGAKAYVNCEADGISVTVYSDDRMTVQVSLPRLLSSANLRPATRGDVAVALPTLERRLERLGIRTNVLEASLSRVDVCRNMELPTVLEDYLEAMQRLQRSRHDRRRYEGGFLWFNGSRQTCVYDKGKEQEEEALEGTTRLEQRWLEKRSIARHVFPWPEAEPVGGQLVTCFHLFEAGWRDACEELLETVSPGAGGDAGLSTAAFSRLLGTVREEDETAYAAKTGLEAVAVAHLVEHGGEEAFLRAVEADGGPRAARRYRKRIEEARGYAADLSEAVQTVEEQLEELRCIALS